MARGFGATRGVGSTDVIGTTVNLTPLSTISFFCFAYRNGGGGGGFGRIFDISTSKAALYHDQSAGQIVFQYGWSTATNSFALWRATAPSSGAWHSIGVTYDPSSTSNDPIIYVDGVSVSITEQSAPSGTAITDNTSGMRIGNRVTTVDRNWDGDLARVAYWRGVAVGASDMLAMHGGTVPSTVEAGSLIYYGSYDTSTTPEVGSNSGVTGTADRDDPTFGVNAAPGAGSLAISGAAPTVAVDGPGAALPGTGSIAAAGQAPTVVLTAHVTAAPGAVALALQGLAPTAVQGAVFVTEPLINNTGTVLSNTAVVWTWWPAGRIGSIEGITAVDGTGTTESDGTLIVLGLSAGAGLLMVAVPNTAATDDAVYYEAGTVA
jgi:hypothetical protein